ncbi:MAG: glycosyltransferase family 39 protein [Chloroflexota bacterium]
MTAALASEPPPTASLSRTRSAILVLIPVVVFLGLTALRIIRRPELNLDEHIFLDVGRQIVDTGLPTRTYGEVTPKLFFDHTPLYVYFVAWLTAIGGPTALIARSVSLVFGVLTVLLVFRIGLDVHGPGSGFVGALMLAANPFFADFSWFVRMEVPLSFFLVLALFLLQRQRLLLAGLAIATAVMLKEIALAFWLVAVAYVLIRRGARAAAIIGLPAPIVFVAWLAYADLIGQHQLLATMRRWLGSSDGSSTSVDKRLHIGPRTWAVTVINSIIGPVLIFGSGATAALVPTLRPRIPAIVAVPIAYVVVAIVASFVIRLKEPRFLIAVIPMVALVIALLVDWDLVWARIRQPHLTGATESR